MVGNKMQMLVIALLLFCGCTNNTKKKALAEFISVTDSRLCLDSLRVNSTGRGYHSSLRSIELCYLIHNYSDNKIFLPIRTWRDSTVKSSISVYLVNKKDTLYPHFYVKKSPYKSNYISARDSMMLFVTISQFQEWSKKSIGLDKSIDSLLDRIHLRYIKSSEDENNDFKIPDIEFSRSPQYYYEIPQDKSILMGIHKDRVLVRQSSIGSDRRGSSLDHFSRQMRCK